ncbi:FAD binding domain-containing protein [Mangrovicoccus algicola]|uniref:FAD binding domain-containing protein n=1 Tax=Mangrovicoccus algicola TaxID=2771008 RepID=A0A8J7CKE1_9RHOB|nr:FAD binding domain-containing protein [Mangrovicoccus algicola]MBE3638686.1 FAD binding domain-containing protein [Mangrovicoccus algicola]
MYPVTYHRPASVEEALHLLAEEEEAMALAGGQTLLPTMKQHLAAPSALVDLAACGLSGIRAEGGGLVIGAMTTHAEIAASAEVAAHLPVLGLVAAGIGDPAVRHRGTIGGSVANNDPAADYPAALLALEARIETDRRVLAAEEFFEGLFATALEEGEIVTRIHLDPPKRAAYAKFPNPASRYALVGVMVAETAAGIRVAVTGAGEDGVFRHAGLEAALDAEFTPDAAAAVRVSPAGLAADLHASAAYRAHLIAVMAARAVAAC